ncbi:MAG: YciI family protein [Cyclobacteriaceae bacterium]
MKLSMILILVLSASASLAQDNDQPENFFMVTYTTGPNWDHAKSPNDQEHFAEHSRHLSQLRKEGVIKLGARAGEEGIIIFVAADMDDAKNLVETDVAVSSGLFNTDVKPFNVFYPGCVER